LFSADSTAVSENKDAHDEYDNFLYSYNTTDTFTSKSLLIPFFAKVTWRPGIFAVNGLAGIYFTLPLSQMEWSDSFYGTSQSGHITSSMGFAAGGSLGVKLGPGILFADVRYMRDFGNTKIEGENFTMDIYNRSLLSFGIGYEIGFINMRKK
jgi:hypothetical protein